MSQKDDKLLTLEVDGRSVTARPGQMLIEVTDSENAYVPRFCYHRKLSVAANCRMCLVDVENAPKPMPACATPVADGMKVFTRSDRALSAQKATMEFLLINHPLDCPICDQGGECELQDLAMGFGRGVSRYTEGKRVVKDKNLGPLVSTDMTRCIHCTRCVRFGQEIAGIQELGAVGRSEDMEIGTYIERSVNHELSGNIIDLCPVGALNNKPYRFGARAWEMVQRPLVSPHDCAGSNLSGHVLRGRLRRIVPRDNDAINETWISDRDRFSCYGLDADDRLEHPMIKRDQEWVRVTWQEALDYAADHIRQATADEGDGLGVLASPSSTLEELYLLRRITDALGSRNIDYRLRRIDFRAQENDESWPALGVNINEINELDGILIVGSNLRMEVPIIAHHIRAAALKGAEVGFVNPVDYPVHFARAAFAEAPLEEFSVVLAGVLQAVSEITGEALPSSVADQLRDVQATEAQQAAARVLLAKERAWLVVGQLALRHPRSADIRLLASALADVTGASLGYLSEGANAAGAALAGCLPHRDPGGRAAGTVGFDAHQMLASPRHAYILLGLEPDEDLAEGALAEAALKSADVVVALTVFASDALLDCADVLLPIGSFAETPGTYINGEGTWQRVDAAAECAGEARPGWRVLRVLADLFDVENCKFADIDAVRAAIDTELELPDADNRFAAELELQLDPVDVDADALDVPIYSVDPLVRRSKPLQATRVAIERSVSGDTRRKTA